MYREFEEYVFGNYNIRDVMITLKYYHSKRVALISKKIAENEGFNYHDVLLSTQIGLLHDIGRFYEVTYFYKFIKNKFDHGTYGVYLLNKNNFFKKFNVHLEDKQELFDAIYYHNKYDLPKKLKNNKFCKVIRDADKLDIIYVLSQNMTYNDDRSNIISKNVLNSFNNSVLIDFKDINSYADYVLSILAFVYDINYDYSLLLLKDLNLLDKFYESLENKTFYKDYFDRVSNYIEKRLKNVR